MSIEKESLNALNIVFKEKNTLCPVYTKVFSFAGMLFFNSNLQQKTN
jgi:hypothetical protein